MFWRRFQGCQRFPILNLTKTLKDRTIPHLKTTYSIIQISKCSATILTEKFLKYFANISVYGLFKDKVIWGIIDQQQQKNTLVNYLSTGFYQKNCLESTNLLFDFFFGVI